MSPSGSRRGRGRSCPCTCSAGRRRSTSSPGSGCRSSRTRRRRSARAGSRRPASPRRSASTRRRTSSASATGPRRVQRRGARRADPDAALPRLEGQEDVRVRRLQLAPRRDPGRRLRIFLPHSDEWTAPREAAARYASSGSASMRPGARRARPRLPPVRRRSPERDRIRAALTEAGIAPPSTTRRRSISSPRSATSATARESCPRPRAPPPTTSRCRSGPGSPPMQQESCDNVRSGWARGCPRELPRAPGFAGEAQPASRRAHCMIPVNRHRRRILPPAASSRPSNACAQPPAAGGRGDSAHPAPALAAAGGRGADRARLVPRLPAALRRRCPRLLRRALSPHDRVVVALKLAVFISFGFYNRWWRYVSTRDMWGSPAAWSPGRCSPTWPLLRCPSRLPRAAGVAVLDLLILLGFVAAPGCSREP